MMCDIFLNILTDLSKHKLCIKAEPTCSVLPVVGRDISRMHCLLWLVVSMIIYVEPAKEYFDQSGGIIKKAFTSFRTRQRISKG